MTIKPTLAFSTTPPEVGEAPAAPPAEVPEGDPEVPVPEPDPPPIPEPDPPVELVAALREMV